MDSPTVPAGSRLEWVYRLKAPTVVLVTLCLTHFALRPLERPAWEVFARSQVGFNISGLEGALGQGIAIGLLGGFRAIVANFTWIRTNTVWERNDLPGTQTLVRLVTAIDPRPLYFWLNGSRMIAYDMPNWRIMEAGGYDAVPEVVQRRIDAEQARVALDYLQGAFAFHPDHPLLYVEVANIHLRRLRDTETAALYYRRAAEQPGAPYYAARIYAELLRQLDRKREAWAWLVELHPALPPDDAFAMSHVVLERIRELETDLELPAAERYQPPDR
jgi:hypothetical protein